MLLCTVTFYKSVTLESNKGNRSNSKVTHKVTAINPLNTLFIVYMLLCYLFSIYNIKIKIIGDIYNT